MNTKHPGMVEFVDDAEKTTKQESASTVPASIAFVDGVAVVKIIHSKRGDEHIIRSYGADGKLLQSTVGRG
jgi:hypothetical protein